MKTAADKEVKAHLAAGRSVSGYIDGKLVTINPKDDK